MRMGESGVLQANFHTADTLSCDGLYENPLALGPCKLIGPVGTLPKRISSTIVPLPKVLTVGHPGRATKNGSLNKYSSFRMVIVLD